MTRISWEANARYLTDAANEVANPADEKERDLGRKDEPKLVALLRWITTTHRARTRAINNGPAPPNPPHNRVTMDEIIDKAAKLDIQMSSLELRGWWTEQSLNLLPKKIVTELEKTP
jgi:hypothetical protein